MTPKRFLIILLLLSVTTALAVGSFRWWHRDFFFVRDVYRSPRPADKERLLAITAKGYHNKQRYTAMSVMLGEALRRVGETQRAVEVLKLQTRFNPGDVGILQAYAEALAANGETDRADHIYSSLLEKTASKNPKETTP